MLTGDYLYFVRRMGMVKTKRKIIIIISIILIVICSVLYFRPISFAQKNDITGLSVIHYAFNVPNGSSIMDTQSYTDVTETQITQVLSLLEDYRYYRKWNTYISDGSLSGLGDDLIQ